MYQVTFLYGCDPRDAGGEFRLEIGEAHLEAKVSATVERDVFEAREIGVMRLRKGQTHLRVKVISAPGRELMALNRILIRRAGSDASPTSGSHA
jgi:hypothetical protein